MTDSDDRIGEFLVAIGYANDDAGAKKVEETVNRVEETLDEADERAGKRRKDREQSDRESAERRAKTTDETGKKVKKTTEEVDDALDKADQAEAKRRKLRDKAEREAADKRQKALTETKLAALGVAGAVVGAATGLFAAVADVAKGYDHLFYTSQRTGASVQNIKAFQYAISQLGGTAEGALGTLESFSERMRSNPGLGSALRQMGVATTTADGKQRDHVDVLQDAIEAFNKKYPNDKYYVQKQLQELFGIDERTAQAIMRDTSKFRAEYTSLLKKFGLNSAEAAERGKEFEQSMRSLGMTLEVVYEKLASDLAPAFTGFVRDLTLWVQQHHKEISGALIAIAKAVKETATAFKDIVVSLKPAWEGFDRLSRSLLGQSGLTTAFEVLGAALLARVLLPLRLISLALMGLRAPAWLLSLLGISGAAAVAGSVALGAVATGHGYQTPEQAAANPEQKEIDSEANGRVGAIKRAWRNRPKFLGGTGGEGGEGDDGSAHSGGRAGAKNIRYHGRTPATGGAAPEGGPSRAKALGVTAKEQGGGSPAEVESFIRDEAAKRGIDPETALRVARTEGLRGYDPKKPDHGGDQGTSFGPWQLHYGGSGIPGMNSAGLGDDFTKTTGLDARDPKTWRQQTQFALDRAAKNGWKDWHGAANNGIPRWAGIGTAKDVAGDTGDLRVKGGPGGQAFAGGKTEAGTIQAARDFQREGMPGGVDHFSAFNDAYHAGTGSKHAEGTAFDMTLRDDSRETYEAAAKVARERLRAAGLKDKDFTVLDERNHPSGRATGPHLHTQFNSKEAAEAYNKWSLAQQKEREAVAAANKPAPTPGPPTVATASSTPAPKEVEAKKPGLLSKLGNLIVSPAEAGEPKQRQEPTFGPKPKPEPGSPTAPKPEPASRPKRQAATTAPTGVIKGSLPSLPPSFTRMEMPKMVAPPIAPPSSSTSNVTNAPSTSIVVHGSSDPQATAYEVGKRLEDVNGRFVRNMQGAMR